MPEHDPRVPDSQRSRGDYIVLPLDPHKLAARIARNTRPACQAYHNHHLCDARFEPDHDRKDQEEHRKANEAFCRLQDAKKMSRALAYELVKDTYKL